MMSKHKYFPTEVSLFLQYSKQFAERPCVCLCETLKASLRVSWGELQLG